MAQSLFGPSRFEYYTRFTIKRKYLLQSIIHSIVTVIYMFEDDPYSHAHVVQFPNNSLQSNTLIPKTIPRDPILVIPIASKSDTYWMVMRFGWNAGALGTVRESTPFFSAAFTFAMSMRSGNWKVRSKEPWTRSESHSLNSGSCSCCS